MLKRGCAQQVIFHISRYDGFLNLARMYLSTLCAQYYQHKPTSTSDVGSEYVNYYGTTGFLFCLRDFCLSNSSSLIQ